MDDRPQVLFARMHKNQLSLQNRVYAVQSEGAVQKSTVEVKLLMLASHQFLGHLGHTAGQVLTH